MLKIDGYQILTQIYESANSEVYRALRESDSQRIILKVLKQDYPTPAELTRYKQEYELTRSLNQEGVIKAYGLEKYQNTLLMFVEDFGGDSLKILRENHQLSLEEFLTIAIKVSTSLGQIHAANIIHKDINPANIVFHLQTQQLKIIDFGISTRLTRENPTLKNPNVLEGTLAYISPEQTGRMNRSLDYRTDFYSLGVTFYELLTGKQPFETDDDLELVHCHIAKQPLFPSEINSLIPPVLGYIVMKLMAKNAEDRYQSAWGLKYDLETGLQELQSTGNIEDFPLATQDISDKFQIPQKLYGRDAEIEILLQAFEKVSHPPNLPLVRGEKGGSELILIAGYSGIGKSALVREIYKPITEKRGYFISGKFDQFQRNIPYSAVVQALGELIKQLLTETQVELNQWREKLLASLGVNGQVIIDVIPEIELIIGKQPVVPELGANESQNRFNFVFQNFIKVFTQAEHPLALFLDDLQWADGASLKLMQLLMNGDAQGLFLIGAYRDNEVSPAHPLMLTLDEIAKNGAIIDRVSLCPLDLVIVAQLISDALKATPENVTPLAELVLLKTGGNPFFLNEFLKSLYTENLLQFNRIDLTWNWDLSDIKKRGFTDNVVELMTGKIKKLPQKTQDILKIGAAIGNEFDLPLVSVFESTSLRDIINRLDTAVSENLVMPLDTRENIELALLNTPNYQLPKYKFIHDRIQQAAYALIPELEKPETHLKIGQILLKNTSPEQQNEKIFDIVNQLNLGKELITNQSERDELAKLNLIAGKKAKASTAYQPALSYLQVGIDLLANDCWQQQYLLTLSLYEEAAETACLQTKFDLMEKLIHDVLDQTKSVLDKVKVYEVKILAYNAQGKFNEASNTSLEILESLQIKLPRKPKNFYVLLRLLQIRLRIGIRPISSLLDLPIMTDPYAKAAISIINKVVGSIYCTNPLLLPLIVCEQITLSLKYGNTSESVFAYSSYGMILCGINDIDMGYNMGMLAINLLDLLKAKGVQAKTECLVNGFIKHWKKHINQTFIPLQTAYKIGVEMGDIEFSNHSVNGYCLHIFLSGLELTWVELEILKYSRIVIQMGQEKCAYLQQLFHQVILNLLDKSPHPDIIAGEAFNEDLMLENMWIRHDLNLMGYFYFFKLMLSFLFGEYNLAVDYALAYESYIGSNLGAFVVPQFYFYSSLTRLAVSVDASIFEQIKIIYKVRSNQKKMKKWAKYAPMNYLHKFYLVEAEICRVLGKNQQAINYYDHAIKLAKENEYIHEAALAYELAAKFYLSQDKEIIAKAYMEEAGYHYQLWGATAKVKDLEKKYPQLLTLTSTRPGIKGKKTTRTVTGIDSGATLDLATVMKASQAISGEIVLEKLLVSLMKIIIQNAGGQLGYLVLETKGELLIEASGVVNDDNITALQSIPLENNLPVTLVNYVARLKEDVVLNDATKEGNFVNDPYIITHQPQSILCTPLLNQGQLIGIVYLENDLTTGAFTEDRLEVIKLLSGQAAIALENARLYQTLEDKVKERTAQLAAANQEISTLNEKLKAENLRLSAELDVAKKLQEMVLPKPAELEKIESLDIAGYMEPADEVGGDYYDVLSSQHGVKIAIGDVTGHGLESGVLMLMVQTAVRTLQKVNETDPIRFLDILNQTLYDNLQRMNSDKNMTLAILDYYYGVVKLSGQHEEMIIVRADGTLEKIDTIDLGFPIGLDAEIADFISEKTVQLNSQDVVILYTDGITEAENLDHELYGLEKLCQIATENRGLSAPEIRQSIIDNLRQFIGNQKIFDDITLVVLKQK